MQTQGERIKEARQALGLSGAAFADKLGLSRGALSNIERNVNGVSDRTLRLICSTFGVDYFWLTKGEGEMFIDDTDALIESLAAEKDYTEEEVDILKKLFKLPPEQFDLVMKLIDNLKEQ